MERRSSRIVLCAHIDPMLQQHRNTVCRFHEHGDVQACLATGCHRVHVCAGIEQDLKDLGAVKDHRRMKWPSHNSEVRIGLEIRTCRDKFFDESNGT